MSRLNASLSEARLWLGLRPKETGGDFHRTNHDKATEPRVEPCRSLQLSLAPLKASIRGRRWLAEGRKYWHAVLPGTASLAGSRRRGDLVFLATSVWGGVTIVLSWNKKSLQAQGGVSQFKYHRLALTFLADWIFFNKCFFICCALRTISGELLLIVIMSLTEGRSAKPSHG